MSRPFRGSTVPVTSVLNITDRQVVASSKAAQARQPAAAFTPLSQKQNGFSAAKGNYGAPVGPGGLGQLKESNAPAPLRGGWRGAVGYQENGVNGSGRGRGRGGGLGAQTLPIHNGPPGARGGRGRGGFGGRGGYTVIDNSDPMDGVQTRNPNFKPQNYSNVPPPQNLDSGRGRGRGRGGAGRGDRGRGRGRGGAQAAAPTQ